MEKTTLIKATNRSAGTLCYDIPDLGIHRVYTEGETKNITFEELEKLTFIPGGLYLLENYLLLDNRTALDELVNREIEPEDLYTQEDVENLLKYGSLEQLEDCLDFCGEGVRDLIQKLAVSTEINDLQKREAIKNMTGFDVSKAIEINHESRPDKPVETKRGQKRRVAINESTPQQRRSEPINKTGYKVVSRG